MSTPISPLKPRGGLNQVLGYLNTVMIMGLVGVVLVAGGALQRQWTSITEFFANPVETLVETERRSAVTYLEQTGEVAVLSAGVNDIIDQEQALKRIPGISRTDFYRLSFVMKLGFDGAQVGIEQLGDSNYYEITVPEFKCLGVANAVDSEGNSLPFIERVATRGWGRIFWDPDDLAVANNAMSCENADDYLSRYTQMLQDSTETFYTSIAKAVDPAAELRFIFA